MKETVAALMGGGLGSVFRYWLSGGVYRFVNPTFPYGTLVVNVLGCFCIGFLMTLFEDRFAAQPLLRIFLTIGVLGGFTTFSTFSYETLALLREGSTLSGLMNVFLSVAGCLLATWLGTVAGKLL
jgi:fluoride exporter